MYGTVFVSFIVERGKGREREREGKATEKERGDEEEREEERGMGRKRSQCLHKIYDLSPVVKENLQVMTSTI